jgi:hypothetical protein
MADARQKGRERCRRYRARQRERNPVMFVPVPLTYCEVDFLVRLGWIDESEISDMRQVGVAIGELIKEAATKK